MKLHIKTLMVILFSFYSSLVQSADFSVSEVDKALAIADEIRSKSPTKFSEYLSKLNEKQNALTAEQYQLLKYLNAYEAAFIGNIAESVKLSKEIINAKVANSEVKFRARLLLINVTAVSKDWSTGLKQLFPVIENLSSIESDELYMNAIGVILVLYNNYGQFEQTLHYSKKQRYTEQGTRLNCLVSVTTLEAKFKLNLITPNQPEVKDAFLSCEMANEKVFLNHLRLSKASYFLTHAEPLKAITLLKRYLPEIEANPYPRMTAEVFSVLAKAYWLSNNTEQAEIYAKKAIGDNKELESSEPVVRAYELLYKIEKDRNNTEQSLYYLEEFNKADKVYINDISAKALAIQLAQHQTWQQKNEIELLNKQNKLLNVEHSLVKTQAENNQLIMILLVVIITLLTFFGYRSWMTQRRLRTLAEYDYLTKIYNRGHFMTLAEDTVKLSDKAKHTVACIIFDLDKFKNVNDTYGHAVGDWVLKATVAAVSECIRENDTLARLGGEEFVILLPSCDLGAACHVAEKCIESLQLIDTQETGFDFKVTASFGITTSHLSNYNLSSLIADADKALYESKNNGRNQFTVFEQNSASL